MSRFMWMVNFSRFIKRVRPLAMGTTFMWIAWGRSISESGMQIVAIQLS